MLRMGYNDFVNEKNRLAVEKITQDLYSDEHYVNKNWEKFTDS